MIRLLHESTTKNECGLAEFPRSLFTNVRYTGFYDDVDADMTETKPFRFLPSFRHGSPPKFFEVLQTKYVCSAKSRLPKATSNPPRSAMNIS
jgi:hypothetical protein